MQYAALLRPTWVTDERIEAGLLDVLEWLVEAAYSGSKAELLCCANLRLDKVRHLWRLSTQSAIGYCTEWKGETYCCMPDYRHVYHPGGN